MGERGTDERIRDLERELRHSPGDGRARLALARELARARRQEEAAAHVERVLRDDPLSRAGLEALDEHGFSPLSHESPWPTVNGGNDRGRRSSQPGARKGVLARRVRIGALAGKLGDGSVECARSLTVGGDGCAYIATDKQRLIALDLNSEQPRWIRDDIKHPFAAPTVGAGERLALACQDTVRLLDGRTGETLWIARSPGVTSDEPANATFAPRGLVLAPGIRGALYALDAITGEMRWSIATKGAQYSAPAVDRGTIFVGCSVGRLYAVDLDGRPRGLAPSTPESHGRWSPVVSRDHVYLGGGGTLVASRIEGGLRGDPLVRLEQREYRTTVLCSLDGTRLLVAQTDLVFRVARKGVAIVEGKLVQEVADYVGVFVPVADSAGCIFGVRSSEAIQWHDPTGAITKIIKVSAGPVVIGPDSTILVPSDQGFLQVIE